MIEIARFADVYEAEIAASRLRADGLTPTLGGGEHARTDPLVVQALGWVRLSVPDKEAASATARLAALQSGAEMIEEPPDGAPEAVPARTLAAKVTLGVALLSFLVGR